VVFESESEDGSKESKQGWESEEDGIEEVKVWLGRWLVAGCQTRPIAEAHHKTDKNDVGSFSEHAGDEHRKEGSARVWPTVSTLITCRFLRCFSSQLWQASSVERSRSSTAAPALVPPPVDRHLLVLMARQRSAGSSRNDNAEPQFTPSAMPFSRISSSISSRRLHLTAMITWEA
jgi:hypothetical protein